MSDLWLNVSAMTRLNQARRLTDTDMQWLAQVVEHIRNGGKVAADKIRPNVQMCFRDVDGFAVLNDEFYMEA